MPTHNVYCVMFQMRQVLLTVGFTMSFGAMFSKTWRVYKIFCNKKLERVVRDCVITSYLAYWCTGFVNIMVTFLCASTKLEYMKGLRAFLERGIR